MPHPSSSTRALRLLAGACLLALAAAPVAADKPRMKNPVASFLDDSSIEYESAAERAKAQDVEHVLYAWAKQGAGLQELRKRLAERYALPSAAANELVALTFARAAFDMYSDDGSEASRLVDRYRTLQAENPGNDAIFDEVVFSVAALRRCDGAALDPLVALRPDEEATRRRLFAQTDCLSLLMPLSARHPDAPDAYLALADGREQAENPTLQLALLRAADAVASMPRSGVAPARQVGLRLERLRSELAAGNATDAIAALPGDGNPLHDPVVAALGVRERLALAAAAWLQDRTADAAAWRTLAAQLPASPDDDSAEEETYSDITGDKRHAKRKPLPPQAQRANLDRLLEHALAPHASDDPFALLALHFDRSEGAWRMDPYWNGIWSPLLDRLALRDGYPGLVAAEGDWVAKHRDEELQDALQACHRCSQRLLDAIRAVRAAPRATAGSSAAAAQATELPEPIRARMDRQLGVPLAQWRESPLPANLRTPRKPQARDSDDPFAAPDADKSAKPGWAKRLPQGELVRYQQDGARIVAITASQSLDPAGEVSGGGYWVSLSRDGGASFDPPLYTGLRVFQPYVIRPASKLSLLDGDTLHIEVALRRVDPDKISFPPIGLPIAEARDDLQLDIPLAELAHDGDGDGLTDIEERALLLDPALADTDGDGLGDAIDPLPQVPRDLSATGHAAALAVALNEVAGKSLGAIVTTAAHSGGEPAQGYALGSGSDAHHAGGATFLVAPARYFGGIDLRERVVVLSPRQAEAMAAVRGVFYPIRIVQFEVARSGDSGVLVWSAGWAGGTFVLKKIDGQWKAESTSSWIT